MLIPRWPAVGLFALCLVFAAAAPAQAARNKPARSTGGGGEACYSQAEFEADQVLELHTELMVIGLKCRTAYPAENPFGAYHEFTRRHRSMISAAERQVMDHLRHAGGRGATQQFDSFRTELANQVSRRAAMIGETGYCALMVPLAVQAPALSDADVRKILADDLALHLARRPPCSAAGRAGRAAGTGAAKMQ
ncbi:MAG: hypothetical protein WCO00_10110 [Rhodospirillaceae bacterium]